MSDMQLAELKTELKEKLIQRLNLEDISSEEIEDDSPLFGEGLGLDSIDALEIIVILDNDYGISIKDAEEGKNVFQSINKIAEYIVQKKNS